MTMPIQDNDKRQAYYRARYQKITEMARRGEARMHAERIMELVQQPNATEAVADYLYTHCKFKGVVVK